MAKSPAARRSSENRNHDYAALRLLDAAFCVDAARRLTCVAEALAADETLRRWAEQSAKAPSAPAGTRDVTEAVAESLCEFLQSLTCAASKSAALPFDAAWRERLSAIAAHVSKSQELARRFDDQLAAAKIDALKEFAYGAGHEINNPLANISARAQTLLRDETHGERRRTLATINRQAMRAHEMIADLMLFARPPQIERSECDAAAIVRRVVEELTPMANLQATQLTCFTAEDSPSVFLDAAQLAVAVKAVIRNALEAVAAGGNVRVESRIVDASDFDRTQPTTAANRADNLSRRLSAATVGQVKRQSTMHSEGPNLRRPDMESPADTEQTNCLLEITIHDDGPGFTAREQAHLFDPFFSGREAGRGLGFGLCLAWRIVTDHGGQIAVMSETGRGATVVLTIPSQELL
jgi:signal transduction histidine kinase